MNSRHVIAAIVLGFILAVVAYCLLRNPVLVVNPRKDWRTLFNTTAVEVDPHLTDCRHVYLDVGSNVGIQIRKLFEPELYPGAAVLPTFDRAFGNVHERRRYVCAYGFEANPKHAARLKRLENCYREKGWRVKFFAPIAVSDTDGDTVKFYTGSNTYTGKRNNEWGATMWNSETRGDVVEVKTMDMSRFVVEHVANRRFELDAITDKAPTVIAKFDIEGSEFQTLFAMIFRGSLCSIDGIMSEVHIRSFDRKLRNGLKQMWSGFSDLVDNNFNCGRQPIIQTMDDESYHNDDTPLPCEPKT